MTGAGIGRAEVLAHGSLALGRPDLVAAGDGLVCLRFETMKVLSAGAAVASLLERGVVAPGDELVDSSSGIYAHALALACHRHGLRCHVVGSTTVDATLRAQLHLLGATLEQMPASSSLRHDQHRRVARVRELLAERPDRHWMRQYHDDVHLLGYAAVADQVAAALGDVPLTLVGGVGTGASSAGIAGRLAELGHAVRLVGVQPFGSVSFGAEHVADPDIIIAGIGSSIPFGNVRHHAFDVVHWMSFDVARAATRDLLAEQAVFAGLSSGAAYLAARHERSRDPGRTVVFLAPDTGHRYLDAVFAGDAHDVDRGTRRSPVEVAGPAELRLPWCRTAWAGRPAPPAARHAEPGEVGPGPGDVGRRHGHGRPDGGRRHRIGRVADVPRRARRTALEGGVDAGPRDAGPSS